MRGCFLLYSTQFLLWSSVHPYHTVRAWGQIQDCCCKTEPFVLPCFLRKTVPPSLRQIVILPRHQSLKIWARERGRATFVFSEKVKQHAAEGRFIGNFDSEWNQLRKSSPGLQGRGQLGQCCQKGSIRFRKGTLNERSCRNNRCVRYAQASLHPISSGAFTRPWIHSGTLSNYSGRTGHIKVSRENLWGRTP